MASAQHTRDHEEIRRWAESRGGRPSIVNGTGSLLRIDFAEPENKLEPINWDEFFRIFDENQLTFLYDPEDSSRFNKFVREESEQAAR